MNHKTYKIRHCLNLFQIERKYDETGSLRKVASYFSCSHENIRRLMLINHIPYKNRKKKRFQKIKRIFEETKNIERAAKICSCSERTLKKYLKKMGVRYKYFHDPNFFKKWTPKMAYILGFVFAEGYISHGFYRLEIPQNDRGILEKIGEAMGSNQRIDNPKGKKSFRLLINSKEIAKDLVRLGMKFGENSLLRFPDIQGEFVPHFLRGYFDGDGSVKNDYCNFASNSLKFLEGIKTILQNLADIKGVIKKGRGCYVLHYNQRKEKIKIFEYIYTSENNDLFLQKKFLKFNKVVEKHKDRIRQEEELLKERILVLRFIRRYRKKYLYSPSLQEIILASNLSYCKAIERIKTLLKLGYLSGARKYRTLKITKKRGKMEPLNNFYKEKCPNCNTFVNAHNRFRHYDKCIYETEKIQV